MKARSRFNHRSIDERIIYDWGAYCLQDDDDDRAVVDEHRREVGYLEAREPDDE